MNKKAIVEQLEPSLYPRNSDLFFTLNCPDRAFLLALPKREVSCNFDISKNLNDHVISALVFPHKEMPMYPFFKRGDNKILIDMADKVIEDGNIYVCFLNHKCLTTDEIMLRRVFKEGNDIILKADNPMAERDSKGKLEKVYSDILIKCGDIPNVILGKVTKTNKNN
ncbi:MAG: S24 family peptidase [bacterium]